MPEGTYLFIGTSVQLNAASVVRPSVFCFIYTLSNFRGVKVREAWQWQFCQPICLPYGKAFLQPQEWCRKKGLGSMTGVYSIYKAISSNGTEGRAELGGREDWKVYPFANLQLLSSSTSKILLLCLLLTCMQVVWRKLPGLRAQRWLIIHLESLLVMLGTLLLWRLMLLRDMPLKL